MLHGEEKAVFGDAGYQGCDQHTENRATETKWQIALRPSKQKGVAGTAQGRILKRIEHIKSSVRAKVEHPFHLIKDIFDLKKVRYKGLFKNTAQLYTLFGLANLLIARRHLAGNDTRIAS